jgi:hypothetical protein
MLKQSVLAKMDSNIFEVMLTIMKDMSNTSFKNCLMRCEFGQIKSLAAKVIRKHRFILIEMISGDSGFIDKSVIPFLCSLGRGKQNSEQTDLYSTVRTESVNAVIRS